MKIRQAFDRVYDLEQVIDRADSFVSAMKLLLKDLRQRRDRAQDTLRQVRRSADQLHIETAQAHYQALAEVCRQLNSSIQEAKL